MHQVNIEHLARVVFTRDEESVTTVAYPDTCVGTDSHTTMVNGIGVVGWGVGGIEAEAAMLGQPVSMLIPRVVGFKLIGELPEGATATDLVLTITEMLRKHGVVGKFVEFYGAGVSALPLANRATIGNMSPEFGSTIAVFPIDEETINYLQASPGAPRSSSRWSRPTPRSRASGTTPTPSPATPRSSSSTWRTVVPSLAGPKRPQDRVSLTDAKDAFRGALADYVVEDEQGYDEAVAESFPASDAALARGRQRLRGTDRPRLGRADGRRTPEQPGDGRRWPTAPSSSSTTARSRSPRSRRAPTPRTRR